MTALLILLGLFSITVLISNISFFKRQNAFSYASIAIAIGYLFSGEGLLPFLPSTVDSLTWAVRVGLTWVTFLAGTRISDRTPSWAQLRRLFPIFVGYLVFFSFSVYLIQFWNISESQDQAMVLALFISAALFSSKENPFLLSILFLSLFLLPNSFGLLDLILPLAVGLLMAMVCRLIIAPSRSLDTSTRLTLLGLCVLGTGWSIGMGSLEVLVGLSLGWAMAWVHKYGVCKDPKLKASEFPIRIVVALFAGLYLDLSATIISVGVALAILRLAIKWGILSLGFREASRAEVLSEVIPISHLALPIIFSLHLSPFTSSNTLFFLSVFCVGFVVNDLIALFLESFRQPSRKQELA